MVYRRKYTYDWVDWEVQNKEIQAQRQERERKYESGEWKRPARKVQKPLEPKDPKLVEKEVANEFYKSKSWKALRNQFLTEKKNSNKLKCRVCGLDLSEHSIHAKKLNAYIHVDHITPLRRNWNRRLDKTNLQILCSTCNWTKGNRDFHDNKERYQTEHFIKNREETRKKQIQKVDRKLSTHPDIDKVREKYEKPVVIESPNGKKTYRISKLKT